MIRLVYLLRRLRPRKPEPSAEERIEPTETDSSATTTAEEPDDQERVTRLIVERLGEDETLRGDLTDAGFAPVMRFVTSLVPGAQTTPNIFGFWHTPVTVTAHAAGQPPSRLGLRPGEVISLRYLIRAAAVKSAHDAAAALAHFLGGSEARVRPKQ